MSVNYVSFKAHQSLLRSVVLHCECVGNCIDYRLYEEMANETVVQQDTGGIVVHQSSSPAANSPVCF